jgi:predicted nucleic acid-binding protein
VRFVATSFWIALQIRTDRHHPDALAIWQERTTPLVTSNHVGGETWTFLRRRLGHAVARTFVDSVASSFRVTIQHVDEGTERDAWSWLRLRDERDYSFVDATSFALMRRLSMFEALAFGGGFAAAGFVEVRP